MDKRDRPAWQVDLKWVLGILSTIFILVSLVLWLATYLTSERVAIPLATLVVASLFSPEGLDAGDVSEIRTEARFQTGDTIYPLEGQDHVSITREELETLSMRELRLKIFQQVVDPYYYETYDPAQRTEILQQAGLLAFLNQTTHRMIRQAFYFSLIPAFIFMIGLIWFSRQWGRLVSPAVVLLIVSAPAAVLLLILTQAGHNEMILAISKEMGPSFWVLSALAIALLIVAGVGKLVMSQLLRRKEHI